MPLTNGKKRRGEDRRFQVGNPGGPGRPKGSKHKLGEAFLSALATDFARHGTAVIAKVRQKTLAVYLRVVADLVPKDINLNARLSFGEEFEAYIKGLNEQGAAA